MLLSAFENSDDFSVFLFLWRCRSLLPSAPSCQKHKIVTQCIISLVK